MSDAKKEKKKAILKRNKRNQMIFQQVKEQQEVVDRNEWGAPKIERDDKEKSREKKEEEVVWSAKVQMIRNRLTDQKRSSQERWNRFAGTEGGGGRGR